MRLAYMIGSWLASCLLLVNQSLTRPLGIIDQKFSNKPSKYMNRIAVTKITKKPETLANSTSLKSSVQISCKNVIWVCKSSASHALSRLASLINLISLHSCELSVLRIGSREAPKSFHKSVEKSVNQKIRGKLAITMKGSAIRLLATQMSWV